ncbi:ABC transporter substrate-binding protein [Corynebacterium bovis]|uniref:ABC transporter substrate-binding protein n=1 Tax=Corynebacterium bovis TaxID=36808 RepID=UPI0031394A58
MTRTTHTRPSSRRPRRTVLLPLTAAVTAVAAGAALAACSEQTASPAGDPAAATSRGPITFAMGKNDTDKLTPIIDAWNAAHPDEKVTLRELAGEADSQRDSLVQTLQSGSSDVDVMALDVVWTAQFAANGWLTPLTGDLAVDTSAMLDAPVESATYRDTLYALPQNTNGQLLYRDTRAVPEAPKNWDDLKQACAAVRDRKQDCLTMQLKQYEGLTISTVDAMYGWGGGLLDDNQKPQVTKPESRAGLTALVDAYRDGTISSASTGTTEEETNLAFTQGQTAMAVNWPYMWTNARKDGSAVKDSVAVSPIVGKDGTGVSTLGGYNNGINVNSKHKATALDFMKFIVSPENQRSFAEASFPPVLASVYDDPALQKDQPYLPALKKSLENARPRPASPRYDEVSKAVQDNAYAAITGGKNVDKATEDMKTAIENISG